MTTLGHTFRPEAKTATPQSTNEKDDHHDNDGTLSPVEREKKEREYYLEHHKWKRGRNTPVEVETSDWYWIPVLVVSMFVIAMLMQRKLKCLKGESIRFVLVKYISAEPLLNSMKGLTRSDHDFEEQRKAEMGQQAFVFMAFVFLVFNLIYENGSYRWVFLILSGIQAPLWVLNMVVDLTLMRKFPEVGVRSVRSFNSKVRFAHSTYQVVLFLTDYIKSGVVQLPPDCYIWATTHYCYEAVALLLEGLNVIGLSELVIILLVNYNAVVNESPSTGSVAAFGITCLGLSCFSLLVAIPFKIRDSLQNQKMLGRGTLSGESFQETPDDSQREAVLLPRGNSDSAPESMRLVN